MNIKIDAKALEILKGISIINQGVVLRQDYLYTKFQSTDIEGGTTKGTDGIVVNYDLPEGAIELAETVGVGNINEFLTVLNSFDKESLELSPQGTTIVMKDKRKKVIFYTATVDALPERILAGEEIYNSGKTIVKLILDESEIEKITKDLSILSVDKLSIKSENSKLKFIAENSITSNTTEIEVPEKYAPIADGDFVFPNSDIFNVVMKGIYLIEVRKCDYDGDDIYICRFESHTHKGLTYTLMSDE